MSDCCAPGAAPTRRPASSGGRRTGLAAPVPETRATCRHPGRVGRLLITLLLVDQGVLRRPLLYLKPPTAAEALELSEPPVYGAIARLEDAGILREETGRARGKTYIYGEYMDILNEGTER